MGEFVGTHTRVTRMTAQDRTLEQYHQLMQLNAASHLIRTGRQVGVLGELREGQRTLEQLCETLNLNAELAKSLMSALVSIGIVEQYEDDYALSRAAHLLCQYDDDLGDARWERLGKLVQGEEARTENDDAKYDAYIAATQWVHTPAAMEAAEILDIGGEGEPTGVAILDLGCGSAVWSSASGYRDQEAKITAVDFPGAIEAANSTASSIGLGDRFETIAGDPRTVELPEEAFDWVMIPQRLSCFDAEGAAELLKVAYRATKPGGRTVVIDLFLSQAKSNLAECIEVLKLDTETRGGYVRTVEQIESELKEAGFSEVQLAFMSKSKAHLGLAVATKAADSDSE